MQEQHAYTSIDFGDTCTIKVKTLSGTAFHQATLSSSSHDDSDCTGLRVYSGSQALGALLLKYPNLVAGQSLVELGCGVGALGLLVAQNLNCRRMLLTDGEPRAVVLANSNLEQVSGDLMIAVQRLRWGDGTETAQAMTGGVFDVCLGADLMYFNIDVRLLLTTALSLVGTWAGAISTGSCRHTNSTETCSCGGLSGLCTASTGGHRSRSSGYVKSDSFLDGDCNGSCAGCHNNRQASNAAGGTANSNSSGIVIFSHISRCHALQEELLVLCSELDAVALEVPIELFTTEHERDAMSCALNIKLIIVHRSGAQLPLSVQQLVAQGLAVPLHCSAAAGADALSSDDDEEFASAIEDGLFG